MNTIKKIEQFSINLRITMLNMALEAGAASSHFGGALSMVEIISTLFSHKMKLKKINDSDWDKRDRFILSKGHACLAYYAALHEIGVISKKELSIMMIFSQLKNLQLFLGGTINKK